jgi:hypothetical protein
VTRRVAALVVTLLVGRTGAAYPTDAFERTQIRRLGWQHAVDEGKARGRSLPPGARWATDRIELKLTGVPDLRLDARTPRDAKLEAGLRALVSRSPFKSYNVVILDITDPTAPRFAAVRENEALLPGSVAKLLIAAALYRELRQRFPDNTAAREAFLRDQRVTADDWALPNVHEVPIVDGESVIYRPVRAGDTFTLWEWLDHMLSASSNAAASMVWREVTLMSLLGAEYPPASRGPELWQRFDKATFSQAAFAAVDSPLLETGIDPATFELRLFFTKGAGKYVDSGATKVTPLALAQWLVAVEQGRMVDAYSSLELKRMLYLTRRRVRYAQAPELTEAAVFFKSGSFYQCAPEPGFECQAYAGNVVNVLNALVEVEFPPLAEVAPTAMADKATPGTPAAVPATPAPATAATAPPPPAAVPATPAPATAVATAPPPPAGATSPPRPRPLNYIVAVTSNELRHDSNYDHALLASYLQQLLQRR